MICFLGDSHAPQTLAAAAVSHGLRVTDEPRLAELIFVSQDAPTDESGRRELTGIDALMRDAKRFKAPCVLTSQVPPGYTRKWQREGLYCMAETLRMKDAMQRARHPEQFIIGVPDPTEYVLPRSLMQYLYAHDARVNVMSYEDAEFAKIAINMFLASQVETTNQLSAAAEKCGAKWERVADALRADSRIGPHAYLTPGRWQDSRHLLRDHVTLEQIIAR